MKKHTHPSHLIEELLQLFDANKSSEWSHFIDDPELVYLWSTHELSDTEMRKIAGHLAQCEYCQTEVANMVQCGAILFEQTEVQTPQVMVAQKAKRTYFSFRALTTISAVALLALVLGLNHINLRPEQVAMNAPPVASIPAPIESLWLIRSSENDAIVKSVENEPITISGNDEQPEFSAFQAVPESQKNTVVYRVAYGQFLLRQSREEAREQFEKAMTLDKNSAEAALGLALVAYAEGDYQTTLHLLGSPAIRRELNPVLQFVVEYNSARAATKLEQWDLAKSHWENSHRLLNQPELADQSDMQSLSDEINNELQLFHLNKD